MILGISLAFSLKCFPLGFSILSFLWNCLSALSVLSFAADLLLTDNYKLINVQEQEVSMNNEIRSHNSGVNMG